MHANVGATLEADAPSRIETIREGEATVSILGRDAVQRRLLAVADVAAAGAALAAALAVAAVSPKAGVIAAVPIIVVVSKLAGLYERDEHVLRKTTLEEAPRLFSVATVFTLAAWLAHSSFATGDLDQHAVLTLWGGLIGTLLAARAIARLVARRVVPAERCLVVGDLAAWELVSKRLRVAHELKATLVGRVPITRERSADHAHAVLGMLDELEHVLSTHEVDRVIVCPALGSSDELLETITVVKGLGVKVSVLPRLFEAVGSTVEFDDLGGVPLLGLRRYRLSRSSALIKRALDIAGATVGLAVLAPLLAVIALLVKLTSPGPVLFRQPRVGRGGERFELLKFRTMRDGADGEKPTLLDRNEADGLFKIADDPRITRCGRDLRRMSLDELPQLVNVLRGEMSLVGPRPLIEEEDRRLVGWHRRRLDITPGMTGVWQVLGSSRIPLTEMVILDYLYRANWSLWLDLKILLRTVPHVLGGRGL